MAPDDLPFVIKSGKELPSAQRVELHDIRKYGENSQEETTHDVGVLHNRHCQEDQFVRLPRLRKMLKRAHSKSVLIQCDRGCASQKATWASNTIDFQGT